MVKKIEVDSNGSIKLEANPKAIQFPCQKDSNLPASKVRKSRQKNQGLRNPLKRQLRKSKNQQENR